MTSEDYETPDDAVLRERRHLLSVAFRMLGTIAEAEDAVQEAYIRWYRLDVEEREAIRVPRAWLTRVVSRICLNVLDSARRRRERYVGPWLPEPVPNEVFAVSPHSAVDPADQVTLDDSISTALLFVLESMTPAERVAFVLHDVFGVTFAEIADTVGRSPAACRQLAASARRRVRDARARRVPRAEHDKVVSAFAAAVRTGDVAALAAVLDPDVVLRSDGGGRVTAARRPVLGADKVARFLLGVARKNPRRTVEAQETADGLGFAVFEEGTIHGILTLDVSRGRVSALWLMVNPDKLTFWI